MKNLDQIEHVVFGSEKENFFLFLVLSNRSSSTEKVGNQFQVAFFESDIDRGLIEIVDVSKLQFFTKSFGLGEGVIFGRFWDFKIYIRFRKALFMRFSKIIVFYIEKAKIIYFSKYFFLLKISKKFELKYHKNCKPYVPRGRKYFQNHLIRYYRKLLFYASSPKYQDPRPMREVRLPYQTSPTLPRPLNMFISKSLIIKKMAQQLLILSYKFFLLNSI